jgi:hypothetical protein
MENSWCACGLLSFGFGWLLSLLARSFSLSAAPQRLVMCLHACIYVGERALVSVYMYTKLNCYL